MNKRTQVSVALATLVVSVLVGVIAATPASATPSKQRDCSSCHGDPGVYAATVTATPSAATVAPSATYTLSMGISENPNGAGFGTGYWVANSTAAGAIVSSTGVYGGGSGSTPQTYARTMTAPSTPGTYYYKVFGVDGLDDSSGIVGFTVYSVNVVAPIHDVDADYLGHYPRVRHIYPGYVGGFFAHYQNAGNVGETFTATLSARDPSGVTATLDTRSLTLAAGERTTVYYPGILTYAVAGTWTITATAGPVVGETDTLHNSWTRERTVESAPLALTGSLRSAHRGPAR